MADGSEPHDHIYPSAAVPVAVAWSMVREGRVYPGYGTRVGREGGYTGTQAQTLRDPYLVYFRYKTLPTAK